MLSAQFVALYKHCKPKPPTHPLHTEFSHQWWKNLQFIQNTLQWRHNGRDSVSNHQPHDCLLNRLFRHRSKKTSKLRVTGLCAANSPGAGEFPAQMTSNAENVSIWWRHHDTHDTVKDADILLCICRHRMTGIGISIIDLRRFDDRLRYIMGIPMAIRRWLLLLLNE